MQVFLSTVLKIGIGIYLAVSRIRIREKDLWIRQKARIRNPAQVEQENEIIYHSSGQLLGGNSAMI